MNNNIFGSYADLYRNLREDLLIHGSKVPSRNGETLELIGYSFVLENPRARLGYHKNRGFNLPFALSEFIFDVVGINNVLLTKMVNENAVQFSDDGLTFNGAYGPRISSHLGRIIEILKKDNNSRQAVISIYNTSDMYITTKDIPCTLSLQFLIRDNKLHLIVSMRSNDIMWGTQYDLFRFTMLQELIANEIGIEIGNYYHIAGSMHVYDKHYEMLNNIAGMESIVMPSQNFTISSCFKIAAKMYALCDGADTALDSDIIKIIAIKIFKDYDIPIPDWAFKFVGKNNA